MPPRKHSQLPWKNYLTVPGPEALKLTVNADFCLYVNQGKQTEQNFSFKSQHLKALCYEMYKMLCCLTKTKV